MANVRKDKRERNQENMNRLNQSVICAVVIVLAAFWCAGAETADDHSKTCTANLRLIDSAKEQWAMAKNKSAREQVNVDEASAYITSHITSLKCPSKGRYSVGLVDDNPTCSVHGDLIMQEVRQASERARLPADAERCIKRMAALFEAQRALALVNNMTTNDFVVATEVVKYAKQNKNLLDCPGGTPYTLGTVAEPPTCAAHPECKISAQAVQYLTRALKNPERFCLRNRRLMDSAKEQWVMANRKKARDPINIEEASRFVSLPITALECPQGGEYSIGVNYDEKPTCSVHGR
jgi:hypothetical protein